MLTDNERSGVLARAAQHLDDMAPAIAGAGRHRQMFRAIFKVGCGYDLTQSECVELLREGYSPRCSPAWTPDQLAEKVSAAYQSSSWRGWLLGDLRSPRPERPLFKIDRNMPEPDPREFSHPREWGAACYRWRKVMRASEHLAGLDGARAGQDRHAHTARVIREVGCGFGLAPETCFDLLWNEWNPRCEPPWTAKKLERRVCDAYLGSPRRESRRRPEMPLMRDHPVQQASAIALAMA